MSSSQLQQNASQLVKSVSSFIVKTAYSDAGIYLKHILLRDILFWGWYLQEHDPSHEINRDDLLRVVGASSSDWLETSLADLNDYCEQLSNGNFRLIPELMEAIVNDNRLFFGKGSFYNLKSDLLGTRSLEENNPVGLTGIDFLLHIHDISPNPKMSDIIMKGVLGKILMGVEIRRVAKSQKVEIYMLQSKVKNWKMYFAILPWYETLSKISVFLPIFQFVERHVEPNVPTVWLLSSIVGEAAQKIDDNRNHYCLWGLNFMAFINRISDAFPDKISRQQISEILPRGFTFTHTERRSRFSTGPLIEELQKAIGQNLD